MAINVKKVNKNINKKENKNKDGKFKLGRNLGTLLIFIGAALFILLCLTPINYITTWNNNKSNPFTDKLDEAALNNVTRMKGKDFDLFEIEFFCQSYDVVGNSAKFSVNFRWTDKTSELASVFKPYNTTNNYTLKSQLCLATDWVSFEEYSSSLTNSKFTKNSPISKTMTVSGIEKFPMKANTWPIKVNVETPTAYLYIWFQYESDGFVHKCPYILEYSYSEYHTENTIGGILN